MTTLIPSWLVELRFCFDFFDSVLFATLTDTVRIQINNVGVIVFCLTFIHGDEIRFIDRLLLIVWLSNMATDIETMISLFLQNYTVHQKRRPVLNFFISV